MDLSIVKIANYTASTVNANAAANITVNFYKLPAGETYSLSPPAALGDPAIVNGSVTSGLTPLPGSQTLGLTKSTVDPYTFDWNAKSLAVDTSGFAPGDQLIVLFTGLAQNDYVAIDNLVIKAVVPAAQAVPALDLWGLGLLALGVAGFAGRRARRVH